MQSKDKRRQEDLAAIERTTLTPLVRQVLDDRSAEIVDWQYHRLQYHHLQYNAKDEDQSGKRAQFHPETSDGDRVATAVAEVLRALDAVDLGSGPMRGVYRFTGNASSEAGAVPWSLILKIQEDHLQRERQAYQSGVLADLSSDLAIPLCYDVEQRTDGDYWLWLEDVEDEYADRWPIARFGLAARHLAHFNGAYLIGRALPDAPWLNRKPSRNWDALAGIIAQLHSVRNHPLMRRAFASDIADGVQRLWKNRNAFLAALDTLPHTLCHLDAQRSNLLTRHTNGRDQTVAVDWGSFGIGALGMEIAQLSVSSRSLRDVDLSQLPELSDVVFEQYLAGLREVGWRGDPHLLRLGYVTSAALQNGLGELGPLRAGVDERRYVRIKLLYGDRSIEENMDRRGELLRFIIGLGDEARELINQAPF